MIALLEVPYSVLLIGIVSPGPALFLIVSQSMGRARLDGIATALGITSCNLFLVLFLVNGMHAMPDLGGNVLKAFQLLGVAYLMYISLSSFMKVVRNQESAIKFRSQGNAGSKGSLLFRGFLFQLANPKVWMFFASALGMTSYYDQTSGIIAILAFVTILSLGWYIIIAILASLVKSERTIDIFSALSSIAMFILAALIGVYIVMD